LDLPLNSKIIFVLIFISFGCGLKTRPKAPSGSSLPSISKSYSTNVEVSKKTETTSKTKKKK
jgi:hypothetical protein